MLQPNHYTEPFQYELHPRWEGCASLITQPGHTMRRTQSSLVGACSELTCRPHRRKAKTAGAHSALPLLNSYDPPENIGKILDPARVSFRIPADSRPRVVSTLAGFGPAKPCALPHPPARDQE